MKTLNINQTLNTKVVSVAELYKLIPASEKYREQQFNDYLHLLSTFIPVIEESGKWEFVQLIPQSSKNGIIFIIRERKCSVISDEVIQPPKIQSITTPITKTILEDHSTEKHKYTVEAKNEKNVDDFPIIKIPEIRKVEDKRMFDDTPLW